MKTYWDLSEKERAALSREDVERYIDAELMMKGVLKVTPLMLEPLPSAPEPTTTYYQVSTGSVYTLDPLFRTAADAEAFLAMRPCREGREWCTGASIKFVDPLREPEIKAVR